MLSASKSGGKQTTRSNQQRDERHTYSENFNRLSEGTPWGPAVPYLTSLFGDAENLYRSGAGLTSPENPMLKSFLDQSQNYMGDTRVSNLLGDTVTGQYLDRPISAGERDVQGMIERAIDPTIKQYQRQILPGLEVQAAKAGRLGSTNYLNQYQQALDNLGANVANTAADIAYQDFGEQRALDYDWRNRERNRQLQGASMLTDINQIPYQRLGQGLAAFDQFGPNPLQDFSTQLDNLMKYRSIYSGLPITTSETGSKSGERTIKGLTSGTETIRQRPTPQQWVRSFGLPYRLFGSSGGGSGHTPLPFPI